MVPLSEPPGVTMEASRNPEKNSGPLKGHTFRAVNGRTNKVQIQSDLDDRVRRRKTEKQKRKYKVVSRRIREKSLKAVLFT
jgi:3'-phosphoadenosine 5'-phosphosulfate (PAPS) 3'-phosphatase